MKCEYCGKEQSIDFNNYCQLKQTPEGLLCQNCRDANIEDNKLYGAPMHVCKAISDARGKANAENLQMMGVAWGQRQTGLERLLIARPCSIGNYHDEIRCENMAQWSYNGYPLCRDHLKQMADMNSDNYEAVRSALEPDTDEQLAIRELQKMPGCEHVSSPADIVTYNVTMVDGEIRFKRLDKEKSL